MHKVCRVCLEKGSQHKQIENKLEDYLDDLLITLDSTVFHKSIVCKKCVSHIQELFDFKTLCLNTEDALFPYIEENASKLAQLDLRSVYSKIKSRQFPKSQENADICRLCLKITTQWLPLETAILETSVQNALEDNLPEISLKAIKHPGICEHCLRMLKCLNSFTSQCKSSINIMRVNGSVETLRDSNEANDDDNEIKVEIQLDNQVKNQVEKLFTDELENQFENQFDNECKIEINENPLDYVENDVERFVQSIPNCIKKEENGDISMHIRAHEEKEICEETVTSMKSKNSSVYTHTGEEPCVCSHCGKRFSKKEHLKRHSLSHKQEKQYICSHCGMGFSKKEDLRSHLRSHTGEKPHICSDCGKGFFHKMNLICHMRVHTGENSYDCPQCEKRFSKRKSLTRHMHTHEEKKNSHICPHCGKGFSRKSRLIDHMHTHTGEKPHICSHCGKGFVSKENLAKHLLAHAGKKPHICSHCGRGFLLKSYLNRHIAIHT